MSNTINVTPEKFKDLKLAYAEALTAGRDSFTWEGREVVVTYARYLIEYLEGHFRGPRGHPDGVISDSAEDMNR